MNLVKVIKLILLVGVFGLGFLWTASSSFSRPADPSDQRKAQPAASAKHSPEDFVGSETCKACHEQQFKSFSKTPSLSRLKRNP